MREREVKLAVGESFELPNLDHVVVGAGVDAPEERAICDVYFDTVDLRLVRWGCTLRHRQGSGWTVKVPVQSSDRSLVRDEVDFVGNPGQPPPEAVDLVGSFSRGQPLQVVARFSTRRVAWPWRTTDGATVLELVDDTVRGETANGSDVAFRQLEVELAPEAKASLLDELVGRLIAAGARLDRSGPKLVQALGEAAKRPPDVAETELGADPTAREVIQAAVARSVAHLLLHVPIARLGEDIEGVHQARIATRRLRSDLRTFKPLLDPMWTISLQHQLRSLAAHLGEVRDADVLLGHLQATLDRHVEIDSEAVERVIEVLIHEHAMARSALLDYLSADQTYRLFDKLVAAAADPLTAPQADDPATERLPVLVRKHWRRLDRAVKALGPEPPVDDLHEVRILAKRARYAAEAVAPAFGADSRRFAKAAEDIQDVLGELNDAAVAERWLVGAADQLDPNAALAAGRLAQVFWAEGTRHWHGWEKAYRKASSKRLRSWFD